MIHYRQILAILFLGISSGDIPAQSMDKIFIENEHLRIAINPLGAELQSIKHLATGREYLWQGDTTYWSGRSPIMFPVNVRFKEDRFTYKGRSYNMPRMGIAVGTRFKVLPTSRQDQISLEMRSSEGTLKQYPFPFRMVVTYRVEGSRLINEFQIENLGRDTMYYALGGHPGFRFSAPSKLRSDYAFTFSSTMRISRHEIVESLVQNDIIPFLNEEDRLGLNDVRIPANGSGMFLKGIPCREVGLAIKGAPPFVKIDLGDFPNVNLWSPPGSPFVCIEPMIGHHDTAGAPFEIREKTFLSKLPAHYSERYRYTIICE